MIVQCLNYEAGSLEEQDNWAREVCRKVEFTTLVWEYLHHIFNDTHPHKQLYEEGDYKELRLLDFNYQMRIILDLDEAASKINYRNLVRGVIWNQSRGSVLGGSVMAPRRVIATGDEPMNPLVLLSTPLYD